MNETHELILNNGKNNDNTYHGIVISKYTTTDDGNLVINLLFKPSEILNVNVYSYSYNSEKNQIIINDDRRTKDIIVSYIVSNLYWEGVLTIIPDNRVLTIEPKNKLNKHSKYEKKFNLLFKIKIVFPEIKNVIIQSIKLFDNETLYKKIENENFTGDIKEYMVLSREVNGQYLEGLEYNMENGSINLSKSFYNLMINNDKQNNLDVYFSLCKIYMVHTISRNELNDNITKCEFIKLQRLEKSNIWVEGKKYIDDITVSIEKVNKFNHYEYKIKNDSNFPKRIALKFWHKKTDLDIKCQKKVSLYKSELDGYHLIFIDVPQKQVEIGRFSVIVNKIY